MEIKTKEIYVAVDGKEFFTKNECLQHEKALEIDIIKRMATIPSVKIDGGVSYIQDAMSGKSVLVIKPQNEKDIETINSWVYLSNDVRAGFTNHYIGELILIGLDLEGKIWFTFGLNDYLTEIQDVYSALEKRIDIIAETLTTQN